MNRELQDYYENRFAMMSTQGWKDLVEDVQVMIDATDRLGGIETEQQLQEGRTVHHELDQDFKRV